MKKIVIWLLSIILIVSFGCAPQTTKVDLEKELSEIENVLEKYVIANENQNFTLIEEIWAGEDNILLLGTDSDEIYTGWVQIKNAIKHQFNSFEDTYIVISNQRIEINDTGNTAWFSEMLNYNFIYQGEAKSFEGIRFTGVLNKNEGKWELVQAHLSIPVEEGTETGKSK
jgi:hypothetical protein